MSIYLILNLKWEAEQIEKAKLIHTYHSEIQLKITLLSCAAERSNFIVKSKAESGVFGFDGIEGEKGEGWLWPALPTNPLAHNDTSVQAERRKPQR